MHAIADACWVLPTIWFPVSATQATQGFGFPGTEFSHDSITQSTIETDRGYCVHENISAVTIGRVTVTVALEKK